MDEKFLKERIWGVYRTTSNFKCDDWFRTFESAKKFTKDHNKQPHNMDYFIREGTLSEILTEY